MDVGAIASESDRWIRGGQAVLADGKREGMKSYVAELVTTTSTGAQSRILVAELPDNSTPLSLFSFLALYAFLCLGIKMSVELPSEVLLLRSVHDTAMCSRYVLFMVSHSVKVLVFVGRGHLRG